MKYIKNLLIVVIVFYISQESKCDNIKLVNLNTWNMTNENGTINIHNLYSPVGVYSALRDIYGDILNSKNDNNLRWIAYNNWTFSTHFGATFDKEQRINLTLHGIDTVSIVYLNNHEIGRTSNMFQRYSFDILPYLKSENILEIKIVSPITAAQTEYMKRNGTNTPPDCSIMGMYASECHINMLRKMQASFGGIGNPVAPSMGIWKPIDLEYYEVAIMRDVDVALSLNDTHWTLDMRIILSSDVKQTFYCEVTFIAVELLNNPLVFKQNISYGSLQIDFKVDIPKERIKLWWPNGYGEQKLYPLYFASSCWQNRDGPRLKSRTKSQKTIDIGFRTIELVEDIDDFGRTFYFKVNDQLIFIKGANYVPSHILPEFSYRENKLLHLLKSAKETHLNMIRVWGGGLYESDIFYNLTDFYGLLVWQDLPFTSATYPLTDSFLASVSKEVSQNARRLAFHPSLCMLVTNNEIELYLSDKAQLGNDSDRLEREYKHIFMDTIPHELNVISRNSFNPRAGPMISTPSMGVKESKKGLLLDPQNPNYGDVHFLQNVNDAWDPDTYPHARFITAYGLKSLPALASWNRTIYSDDLLYEIVKHREHDENGYIFMLMLLWSYFGLEPAYWDNTEILVYLSQLSQAIATKTATDVFRSQRTRKRTMGAMYWQLNDNWVAPTSSSIDYFGNYKIVWNWSKEFMAPTAIIALMDVKNDRINVTVTKEESVSDIRKPEKFNITVYTFLWSELFHRKTMAWDISVGTNGIYTSYLDMKALYAQPFTRTNCFLKFVLTQYNKTISSTFIIPKNISSIVGLTDPKIHYDLTSQYCLKTNIECVQYHTITITIKKPALFVYIEVYHPDVENYKLSENGIIITEPIKVIQLQIALKKSSCITLTQKHVRIMTINEVVFHNKQPYGTYNNKESIEVLTTKQ